MKQRVTALDLQILEKELQNELTNYRLQNIYNIATSNKQYLLKFALPDSKKNVVLDSGFKIHMTEFSRPTPQAPSNFVVKLRKHLKSRRLSSIKQVGIDRVLVLTFSDGMFYLVLEFFSAGNIVLLDHERKIMALQRLVEEKGNNDRYAVGETYNLFDETLFDEDEEPKPKHIASHHDASTIQQWISDKKASSTEDKTQGKKTKVLSIQKVLYQKVPYLSADLISKNLHKVGINPSSSSLDYLENSGLIANALNETEAEVQSILNTNPLTGYIVLKNNTLYDAEKDEEDVKFLYEQFHPFEPIQLKDDEQLLPIQGYNKTLDKFFSTIESSKYALRIQNQENQAKKRLEQAKNNKQQQVQRLVDVQAVNSLKGETIIFNAEVIEEAKAAVQALLDQSMDWKTIEKLIKIEKAKNNKVASVINIPLNLKDNKISLNLLTEAAYEDDEEESDSSSDSDSDSDDEEENSKKVKDHKVKNSINVTIDLGLSAYANASEYFTVKKSTVEKQKKVEQSTSKALKNIEQRIEKDLKKNLKQENDILRKLRNPYFFEKFNWFISNENYLIISGKDDAQTDLIYHRYVTDDDIYVHADIDGSSHVFIKNPNKGEVSPSTLMQAGILSLATSKAWDNKMVTSPWWLYASDVSKKDIDGTILKAGTFRYLKEKNFLPPSQLVMGFAFLWKIKTEDNEKELEQQLEELDNLDINEIQKDEKAEDEATESETQSIKEQPVVDSEDAKEEQQKGFEPEETNDAEEEDEHTSREESPENESQFDTMSLATNAPKQRKPVRGKKSKMKKIATKYADQDEEERRLRMEVLGTLKQQTQREEELKKQQIQKINHLKKVEKKKRQEEVTANKYANHKEDINYEKILNELTPTIHKEDEVLEAIPVFAPWNALTKYRYRVKIQPGSTKKGKALQEALHYFNMRPTDATENDRNYDWPREHEALSGLKDTELLPSIYVGKLKVMLPGKSSAPKNSRATNSKKSKKK